jgi:hypothetical protein
MSKRYGSEMNWFKMMGGLTISMNISLEIFNSNLLKIMKNTNHNNCIENITR